MKYLSIAQTAERWGISTRRIQILCGEGRVPGAIRIGTVWGIPEDAEKPADARIKNGKYIKKPVTTEFITQEEAQGRFDLERLPDGASETVRVVKVGDYDECLCIGVHVENTSEIGTFKIISHDWDEEAKRWRMRFKLV